MLTSRTPYLLRAIYEWIADNDLTPYLLVDANAENVMVPAHVVKDGKVVLNVSMSAVRNLELSNEFVSFDARFGGKAETIYVPVAAVEGIYAKETGAGMVFDDNASSAPVAMSDDDDGLPPKPPSPQGPSGGSKPKPTLRVVK